MSSEKIEYQFEYNDYIIFIDRDLGFIDHYIIRFKIIDKKTFDVYNSKYSTSYTYMLSIKKKLFEEGNKDDDEINDESNNEDENQEENQDNDNEENHDIVNLDLMNFIRYCIQKRKNCIFNVTKNEDIINLIFLVKTKEMINFEIEKGYKSNDYLIELMKNMKTTYETRIEELEKRIQAIEKSNIYK